MKKSIVCTMLLVFAVSVAVYETALTQTQGQGAPEIIIHKTNPHHAEAVPTGGTGTVSPPITYHGGALIANPTIYYIWYGNWNQNNGADTPDGQTILRDFAKGIDGSAYYGINTTYSTNGYNITGNVSFGAETTDAYSRGKRLRDADILTIVNNSISTGKLPFNTSGVYFVLTSSDVSEQSGFCTKYCGWHTSAARTGGRVRYSFVGNAARCLSACSAQTIGPNGNAGVDAMVSIIAHELEEAATDADPGSNPGWYDSKGAENADKCAWTFGHSIQTIPAGQPNAGAQYNVTFGGKNYLIQRNLKHDAGGDTCNMDLINQ